MLLCLFPALNQGSGGNVLSVATSLQGDSWDLLSKALQNLIWTPFLVLRGSSRALRLKAIRDRAYPRTDSQKQFVWESPEWALNTVGKVSFHLWFGGTWKTWFLLTTLSDLVSGSQVSVCKREMETHFSGVQWTASTVHGGRLKVVCAV